MRTACPHSYRRFVTMTIYKPVLGTGYSGTVFVTGALHMQLHMDDVVIDDVMIFLYSMYGIQIITRTVRVNKTLVFCCHAHQYTSLHAKYPDW